MTIKPHLASKTAPLSLGAETQKENEIKQTVCTS